MKNALLIAFFIALLLGCSRSSHPWAGRYVEVVFDGKSEVVLGAKSATSDRRCMLHGDALSYVLVKWRVTFASGVIDFERERMEKVFSEALKIAPNAIPFPPHHLISVSEYRGGPMILPAGAGDQARVVEYCPTCERVMQDTLRSAPNGAGTSGQ